MGQCFLLPTFFVILRLKNLLICDVRYVARLKNIFIVQERVLCSTSLKFQACEETCACDRTPHIPNPEVTKQLVSFVVNFRFLQDFYLVNFNNINLVIFVLMKYTVRLLQISKMENFATIFSSLQALTNIIKFSILDIFRGPGYRYIP